MSLRPCLECGAPSDRTRCTVCRRRKDRARNAARGDRYGLEHRRARAAWAPHVAAGDVPCARCGEPIAPSAVWDLDHLADGTSRPAHAACNRGARAAPAPTPRGVGGTPGGTGGRYP